MFVQLVIFILAYFGLWMYKENGTPFQRQQAHKKYVIFLMVLLILQSGLRNVAVGDDTYQYYSHFDSVMKSTWSQVLFDATLQGAKDPGYSILTKLFSMVFPSYRLYLIAIAIFFFTALGRLLYRYLGTNLDVFVSVALYQCLYYGFFSITGLRQTIATGILLFALPFALEKRAWFKNAFWFWAFLFLATTIHKTAFLFAPVYFLPRIRNNKIVFWGALILFVPMFSAGSFIGPFLAASDFEQYAHYLEQGDTLGATVFTIFIVTVFLAVFFKLKTINSFSPYNHVFTTAIAIAMFLSPLLILNPNNMRIVQYYSIFALIILPMICKAYSGYLGKRQLYYILFAVLALYTIMRNQPYAFFWQDMAFEDTGVILNDSNL